MAPMDTRTRVHLLRRSMATIFWIFKVFTSSG